jgi:hypothetical protein
MKALTEHRAYHHQGGYILRTDISGQFYVAALQFTAGDFERREALFTHVSDVGSK